MNREETIKWLESLKTEIGKSEHRMLWHYAEAIDMAIEALSAEAVQGEWKHTITGQPYCSNCEYVFGEDEEFSPFWDYCPMCGTRIKGDTE